jgi:carboxymethylenebutenolidase
LRIVTESIDIPRGDRVMRSFVARPAAAGRWPALAFYSDIFQLTPSTKRMVERFAGYGFAVAAPDIYWRYEPPGEAWAFDDAGRDRGNLHARTMRVRDFDDDIAALLGALPSWPFVEPGGIGAVGFCTGGHIGLRAAFASQVRATVLFYPTGLHDGELAGDPDAGTLARLREVHGELLMIFGTLDPHTPENGRTLIAERLTASGVRGRIAYYEGEHAFMRDEGPRYDPELTDRALSEAMTVLEVLRAPT